MKTIGIIGGIAWPSTIVYYRTINQMARSSASARHVAGRRRCTEPGRLARRPGVAPG
jgi:hypothetical protein